MNLPPYISRTPPPLNETEDDEDEEFGTFAVCSDLGEEVCDAFEKNSHIMRGDDNVSEDSGFCMNSVCQTQSPCDVSPLSSSYYKSNECMGIENHGNNVDSSPKETESSKSEDLKLNDSCFDHSSFTQDFETFQNEEIYIESSNPVGEPEFSQKSFKSKISDSRSSVNGIEEVSFVDNHAIHIVANTTVNGDILLSGDFDQVANDRNFQESLKINEPDWFRSSSEKFILDTVNDVQYPEFPTLPCSEKGTKYFSNDNANEENIEFVKNWGPEDDDFSDFTSFQVVESVSEIPYRKFEFQFGESETVPKEGTDHIYETLQSTIESNYLWNSLRCFEETHAFKYQWSTSCTQMKFLQALHIDSRNILCGPWNKMNKINLADTSYSFEISTYNVDAFSSTNSTRNKEMIPDAHFDWVTSGLINPLQGTSEKEITHDMEENDVTEILKSRSRDVLSSLPNHNFLKLTYISFK
ncbi:uncharacterized protein Afti isoform X2 [Halyomorpha halys]|uniref:uncharacterized protein Afti isoform X2 n=1 Tax=Halyomorpha halys TaxID=286706 RepID=UPI0006D50AEE|nr:uncharacterized protein LOC106691131 isoform X2 [Halyomorpha halys]